MHCNMKHEQASDLTSLDAVGACGQRARRVEPVPVSKRVWNVTYLRKVHPHWETPAATGKGQLRYAQALDKDARSHETYRPVEPVSPKPLDMIEV